MCDIILLGHCLNILTNVYKRKRNFLFKYTTIAKFVV